MMLVTTDDATRLNVVVEGPADGPVVLMMHSIGCDLTLWNPQAAALASEVRVVRYDARGHGGSDAPAGDYTTERLGRDALAVLDAVGAETAWLCGLSLGGITGQWLALHASGRVKGMAIANTAARIGTAEAWQARGDTALAEGMQALAPTAITRFFSGEFRAARPEVVAPFFQRLLATAPRGYAGCCAVLRDADFTRELGSMAVPAVVIGGVRDVPTPLSQAEELVNGIPGARLVALDAGHLSNVEQPAGFTAAVRQLMREG
jgi:3-oxoadipate enol-lactonase